MSKISKSEKKVSYKLMNWSDYNKSLCNRGSLTIWISEDVLSNWYAEKEAVRGGQTRYSDKCIECLLSFKMVLGYPYRQTIGFVKSLLGLMKLDLSVPSYSQLCRRASDLEIPLDVPARPAGGIMHIVVDSTGLKVYGEGEWKVRKHGHSKRRTWRKLHLAIDPDYGYIHGCELTGNDADDASMVEGLLEQVEVPVDRFSGDGAYDHFKVWDTMDDKGIEGIIPPRKNAVFSLNEEGKMEDTQRNRILERIGGIGREYWKQESDYHKRSLSETAMFRFKNIFGAQLSTRKLKKQKVEAKLKSKILNKFTAIGMPVSIAWN